MPRRSVALLALAAAAACFSDKGIDLSGTAGGPVPSTSESPDPAGTSTGAEPTGTTAEPTTTTTTTTAPTTAAETTDAPVCADPQCEPGDVRDGQPCGVCNFEREVCGRDCTWAPAGCAESSVCGYWTYTEKIGWQVLHPAPSAHAPQGPVTAAFELPQEGRVVALTAGGYHVLAPDGAWIASGAVATLFPATSDPILHAFTTPGDGSYFVTVIASPTVQIYTVNPDPLSASLFSEPPCCGSWTGDLSPPSLAAVRDIYIDLDNTPSWAALDPPSLCGVEAPGPVPYGAWITADTVYVQDGFCDQMAYAVPYTTFPPFAQPGAPPGAEVGGVAMLGERLYVFPGE